MTEHTQSTQPPTASTSQSGKSPWRVLAQLVGFLLGLAMLGWCVQIAFAPENREQLERLLDASPWQILAMLGLSVAVLIVNGLIFWLLLRPSVRLPAADVVATNAVGTFMAYLPFKLGMLVRIMIHNRRDKVPLVTISAWIVSWVVVLGLALGPMALAAVIRPTIDVVWLGMVAVSMAIGVAATIVVARRYRGERGEQRLRRWAKMTRITPIERLMNTGLFRTAHDGLAMLCDPAMLGSATVLRAIDMGLQGGRFLVAAWVLGVDLSLGESVLIAVAYFLIGVATPVGVLGSREAGIVALGALLGLEHLVGSGADGDDAVNTLAILALFVTGTETVAFLACAGVGAAWLRIDRLLLKGRWHEDEPAMCDEDASGRTPDGDGEESEVASSVSSASPDEKST